MKTEIQWMSTEETNNLMERAMSSGIFKVELLDKNESERVIREMRDVLSNFDFPTLVQLVCSAQKMSYGVVFELNEIPYEFNKETWLKIANEVLASM